MFFFFCWKHLRLRNLQRSSQGCQLDILFSFCAPRVVASPSLSSAKLVIIWGAAGGVNTWASALPASPRLRGSGDGKGHPSDYVGQKAGVSPSCKTNGRRPNCTNPAAVVSFSTPMDNMVLIWTLLLCILRSSSLRRFWSTLQQAERTAN